MKARKKANTDLTGTCHSRQRWLAVKTLPTRATTFDDDYDDDDDDDNDDDDDDDDVAEAVVMRPTGQERGKKRWSAK